MTASLGIPFDRARRDPEFWGRLVESAVGAHLINGTRGSRWKVSYGLERDREVDFVLHRGRTVIPLEVKNGRRKRGLPGMKAFSDAFRVDLALVIGPGGGGGRGVSPASLSNTGSALKGA